jgi:hypothetical protein
VNGTPSFDGHPSLLTALVLRITVAALGRKLLDALLPGAGDEEEGVASAMDRLHRIANREKPPD